MHTIFGPINSRRFGVSLGIDLSPMTKQCNFDCLYCELAPAKTTDKQLNTVDVERIIKELKEHLNENIDVITITANGEPTLYPYLDKLVDEINNIKNNTQTLILTNSATLTDKKVFDTLLKLDQVKLSLDAISKDVFKKLDRPHKNIDIEEILNKVIEFSRVYKGKLFIEILFVKNLNDTKEEIKKLNDALLKIKASRIDIGTIDRPPAYNVEGIGYKKLLDISRIFDSTLPIHITSRKGADTVTSSYTEDEILNTLDKRPLTMQDIELLFDKESQKKLTQLINKNKILKKTVQNLEFFLPNANLQRKQQK